MESILSLNNVTKRYQGFTLDHLSFELPRGTIFGMIGENGAGKTTLIRGILDLLRLDEGEIQVFGKRYGQDDSKIKEKIGVVLDGVNQNPFLRCGDLDRILKGIYKNWDSERFFSYLEKWKLPKEKKIKDLSKGMHVKLNFAAALSYSPELLVLDEATSGLDPVMRSELLEELQEFVMDERKSVLLSTHITSDLDKIADYVLFLQEGKQLFLKSREELEKYGVLHCTEEFLEALSKDDYEAFLKEELSCRVLVKDRYEMKRHFEGLYLDQASLEELMVFFAKGERV